MPMYGNKSRKRCWFEKVQAEALAYCLDPIYMAYSKEQHILILTLLSLLDVNSRLDWSNVLGFTVISRPFVLSGNIQTVSESWETALHTEHRVITVIVAGSPRMVTREVHRPPIRRVPECLYGGSKFDGTYDVIVTILVRHLNFVLIFFHF